MANRRGGCCRFKSTHPARDATAYANTYYRTIYELDRGTGFLFTFARLDPETAESICKDRDKLTRELETALAQSVIRGDPLQRTAKPPAKRMGVAESRAMTLVAANFAAAGVADSMTEH